MVAPLAWGQGYSVVGPTGGAPPPTATNTNNPNGAIAVMPTASNQGAVQPSAGAQGLTRGRRPEEYAGLAPGMPRLSPGLTRMLGLRRGARNPVVAWPGFQMVPGGSRLFLATTQPVTVTESTPRSGVRVIHLAHAIALRSNTRRPLETAAFETPLAQAVLRSGRDGLDLVMTLRAEVAPRVSQEAGGAGLSMLYVDFPAYTLPNEIARIHAPNGSTVVVQGNGAPGGRAAPSNAAPPPQATPVSQPPMLDNERPPGMR